MKWGYCTAQICNFGIMSFTHTLPMFVCFFNTFYLTGTYFNALIMYIFGDTILTRKQQFLTHGVKNERIFRNIFL